MSGWRIPDTSDAPSPQMPCVAFCVSKVLIPGVSQRVSGVGLGSVVVALGATATFGTEVGVRVGAADALSAYAVGVGAETFMPLVLSAVVGLPLAVLLCAGASSSYESDETNGGFEKQPTSRAMAIHTAQ